jgi:hypothetical protein
LGEKETLTTRKTEKGLEVLLSDKAPGSFLPVVKLEFAKGLTLPEAVWPGPGGDGKIHLTALDADCVGHYDGNLRTFGKDQEAFLGNWKNPKYRVEYMLTNPVVGTWKVRAEISAREKSNLELVVGKDTRPATVAATGEGWQWQELGEVFLPAGLVTLVLRPAGDWKEIRLRGVELAPVP